MLLAQVFASIIFLVMFYLIITEKFERHWITLVSSCFTLFFVFGIGFNFSQKTIVAIIETLNVNTIFSLEQYIQENIGIGILFNYSFFILDFFFPLNISLKSSNLLLDIILFILLISSIFSFVPISLKVKLVKILSINSLFFEFSLSVLL